MTTQQNTNAQQNIFTIPDSVKGTIADYVQSAIFDTQEKFYFGEKIRLEQEVKELKESIKEQENLKEEFKAEIDALKAKKGDNQAQIALNEAKIALINKELAPLKTELKEKQAGFDWLSLNYIYDVDTIDEIKIRLLLRKNGCKNLPLFRKTQEDQEKEYESALRMFYIACAEVVGLQAKQLDGGKVGQKMILDAKKSARKLSEKACQALTGKDNNTVVFSVSGKTLDDLILTIPRTKKEAIKEASLINNKTRNYRTFEGFNPFKKKFEIYVAQTLEGLSIDAPIDKKQFSDKDIEAFLAWRKEQEEAEKREKKQAQAQAEAEKQAEAALNDLPPEEDK